LVLIYFRRIKPSFAISVASNLRFYITNGDHVFNPGLISAPAERPVLIRQADIGFKPQRGDLLNAY
jgi:hypothetical protein